MTRFSVYGHSNVLATHANTLEFTKDERLKPEGNCVLGVRADFRLAKIRAFIHRLQERGSKAVVIRIIGKDVTDVINAHINPDFRDSHELVIRRSGFLSPRTFAVMADKAAADIDRGIVRQLQHPGEKLEIVIEKA